MTQRTLLTLCTVTLLALAGCSSNDDSASAPETSTSASTSASPTSTKPQTACEREASKETSIAKAPTVDQWKDWGTASRPVSEQFGGKEIAANGAPSCFAHSPEGAVFASATYFGSLLSQEEFRQVVMDHLYPSDEAQAFYDSWSTRAAEAYGENADTSYEVRGYKLENYTSKETTVSIALGVDGIKDRYMVVRLPLIWEHGDWQINASEKTDEELYTEMSDFVTSLEGFTEWGPDKS